VRSPSLTSRNHGLFGINNHSSKMDSDGDLSIVEM
jgi:hypothetical protein